MSIRDLSKGEHSARTSRVASNNRQAIIESRYIGWLERKTVLRIFMSRGEIRRSSVQPIVKCDQVNVPLSYRQIFSGCTGRGDLGSFLIAFPLTSPAQQLIRSHILHRFGVESQPGTRRSCRVGPVRHTKTPRVS